MELSMESVFSHSGLLGHLSYILLIVSMLSWKMFWLRVGVIGSALAGIAYGLIILNDPVAVFWQTLLLLVNLFQLVRLILAERSVSLSKEESEMVRTAFSGLGELDARMLIDQGFWIDREAGIELIREGTAVDNLYYLTSGMAEVRSRNKIVGHCKAGDLIGEGTILSSDKATGTVTLSRDSRLWCIPAPVLRRHLKKNPAVRNIVDRRIGDALKSKLRASNVALSQAGGLKN